MLCLFLFLFKLLKAVDMYLTDKKATGLTQNNVIYEQYSVVWLTFEISRQST